MFIIIGISIIGVLILIWGISSYNNLVNTREKVENSWGQINVQLKMRADLVPNLVQTVSGYAKHEKETFTAVMEARNKFMESKTPENAMSSSSEMSGLMGRLFAVAEQYPQLKADQNFLNLQNQLNELEQKVSMYRQFYNDTVMMYNRLIITFPKNIFAGIFGFREIPYFQVDQSERKAPQVKF
ncbi:MAG: LemA family protein [Lachnospiraceae bacterium]|nr:LemA family protein [Lachnospiraceae bacterium]